MVEEESHSCKSMVRGGRTWPRIRQVAEERAKEIKKEMEREERDSSYSDDRVTVVNGRRTGIGYAMAKHESPSAGALLP